jgi:hypothetical protein
MAKDFKYVGQSSGATVASQKVIAGEAVEAGDFLDAGRAKAVAADTALSWYVLEDADNAAEVTVIPVLPGMIFEGTTDGAVATLGLAVSLAGTTTQVIDADAGAGTAFFRALDVVTGADTIRVMYMG